MGDNGRYIGTKRWVMEYGRWVRRVPKTALWWLREYGLIARDNKPPLPAPITDEGPPGVHRPAMNRTRPRRRA